MCIRDRLRGARGNSGVILSLLFRGFSKGLKGRQEADGADLAAALTLGVEAAYKAVMKPTEGTILTVAREAADKGRQAAEKDPSPETVWAAICDEADASLQRTPELLPVLKKAGVVDAGGQGLCIILRAMLDVFNGGEIVAGDAEEKTASAVKAVSAAGSFDADITFTYCTEYILSLIHIFFGCKCAVGNNRFLRVFLNGRRILPGRYDGHLAILSIVQMGAPEVGTLVDVHGQPLCRQLPGMAGRIR